MTEVETEGHVAPLQMKNRRLEANRRGKALVKQLAGPIGDWQVRAAHLDAVEVANRSTPDDRRAAAAGLADLRSLVLERRSTLAAQALDDLGTDAVQNALVALDRLLSRLVRTPQPST